MWAPWQTQDRELINLFLSMLGNQEIKAEISRQIRIEMGNNMDNRKYRYNGEVQSYESLTSGNVNMQARMAASGYDVYGRTILSGNKSASNQNTYKKMKNKIKYGRAPQNGYYNRGGYTIE